MNPQHVLVSPVLWERIAIFPAYHLHDCHWYLHSSPLPNVLLSRLHTMCKTETASTGRWSELTACGYKELHIYPMETDTQGSRVVKSHMGMIDEVEYVDMDGDHPTMLRVPTAVC